MRRGNVELGVYESGDAERPTVVCVHGYPDDHTVWDGVVARLAGGFHVVTYDVRGSGASSAPRTRAAYRVEELAADLRAVADTVSPNAPVHLVGHDWGSIQAWQAVTDPDADKRFASYTSMSGPCLEHITRWTARQRTWRPSAWYALASQLLRSWYIGFFTLPVLPELAVRTGALRLGLQMMQRGEGIRAGRGLRTGGGVRSRDGVRERGRSAGRVPGHIDRRGLRWGIEMYRANISGRMLPGRRETTRDAGGGRTEVPIQLMIARYDAYVGAVLAGEAARWVPNLYRREIPAGHWAPRSHPARVARLIAEFVDATCRGHASEPAR